MTLYSIYDYYMTLLCASIYLPKMLSKMALIAVIADEMGMHNEAKVVVERLKPYVESWITQLSGNKIVYDDTWGGLVCPPSSSIL